MVEYSQDNVKKVSRRTMIAGLTIGTAGIIADIAGSAISPPVLAQEQKPEESIKVTALSSQIPHDKSILRMQRELQEAMTKPASQRNFAMGIDIRKCVGCSSCTVACKAENKLPPGVVYRPVIEEEYGSYPHVARRFFPRPCMHCANSPCTKVCPVKATYKTEDGIVVIDYDKCIGCRYCISACPYGARTFDWGEYYTNGTPCKEKYECDPSFEYGKLWPRQKRQSPIGNTRKCHFCWHRLKVGMLPMCVTTCIGRATFFGDTRNKHSLIAELKGSSRVMHLKPELGTFPTVFYLT